MTDEKCKADKKSSVETAMAKRQKHTTGGIPRWSPTLVLVARFSAYVWQSGRDAQFSLTYGRMYLELSIEIYIAQNNIILGVWPCALACNRHEGLQEPTPATGLEPKRRSRPSAYERLSDAAKSERCGACEAFRFSALLKSAERANLCHVAPLLLDFFDVDKVNNDRINYTAPRSMLGDIIYRQQLF
jgi:hypothetical protein